MSSQESCAASPPPDQPQSIHEFVRRAIRSGTIVPLPCRESWDQMSERINADHWTHEVDGETFDHFLDVLPPRYLGRGWFAFAEGAEPIRLFVRDKGLFLTRRLSWDESDQLCRLAEVQAAS